MNRDSTVSDSESGWLVTVTVSTLIWKPDPLDENPIIVYTLIISVYTEPEILLVRPTRSQSLSKMLRYEQNEMFTFEIDSEKCYSRLYTGTLKRPHFSVPASEELT